MPASRKYKSQQDAVSSSPMSFGALPIERPIAVYYRQSSMGQVGNISTDMQQIDLPKHVISLGWQTDSIILINEDEGVSGAKRIDERLGMSRLFDLIITGKIGAVAVQAEDRLFRDETQIQVNVFIDACVKNNVRVLTPYFKYNFADKYEGSYHRLLFRMRTEQAADFLNSYIRGRLYAAKERMLIQGMWMGGNINLGYMVDNRKTLPSGISNPDWRKYHPFQPCAEIVVKIFETFVMLGGNQRATILYLHQNGLHFPDFDNPELLHHVPPGFTWAKPMRMLKRGGVYVLGTVQLQTMLTNAVYLGHWVFKNHVVQWNNHPAIVSEDLFYRAFNYLSPYGLDGKSNPNYSPRVRRSSNQKKQRGVAEPTYIGLVGSYHQGHWRTATASWTTGMQMYAYTVNYLNVEGVQKHLWSRRSDYFDKIIDEMLFAKLRATFDKQIWENVIKSASEDFEKEQRILQHQLTATDQKLKSLIDSFAYVQSKTLAQALELQFEALEQEKARLVEKLNDLNLRIQHQDGLVALAQQADNVLQNWSHMPLIEKQGVAEVFIERIVVSQTDKHRVADLLIHWRDESIDELVLPWSAKTWTVWLPEEVSALKKLIEEEASQEQISYALPNRNWRAIRIKAYEIIGKRSFHISPKPIREDEKYADYQNRLNKTNGQGKHSSSRWVEKELTTLANLLDAGVNQVQICAAIPHRSWAKLRKKITQLRGANFKVGKPAVPMLPHETIREYVVRNPEQAVTMNFSVSSYWSPQTPTRTPSPPLPASGPAPRPPPLG